MQKNKTDSNQSQIYPEIQGYLNKLKTDSKIISEERKRILANLSKYIEIKLKSNLTINLLFICTHNSRRSHLAHIWAQVAASAYNISKLNCFSGGTETTAFNFRLIKSLEKAGFKINHTEDSENPLYNVFFSSYDQAIIAFSKKFNHKSNPDKNFAAVMTCSEADEACPFIPGADIRFNLSYEDPKIADNTIYEEEVYEERCKQIAAEMIFVFSNVKLT